jgi:hypothetical protein
LRETKHHNNLTTMKTQITTIALIIHFSLFIIHSGHSQDSLRYSQESGTLEKQRFIDQYDYVFMTKEPTRWMLKAIALPMGNMGLVNNAIYFTKKTEDISPLWLNLEYKLSKSLSVQVGGSYYSNGLNQNEREEVWANYGKSIKYNWIGTTELRWFYDMKRRIAEGKSANNFSGNYLSVRADKVFVTAKPDYETLLTYFQQSPYSITNEKSTDVFDTRNVFRQLTSRVSISYGLQRRFLRHGLVDLGLSLDLNQYRQLEQNITFANGNTLIRSYDINQLTPTPPSINSTWREAGTASDWNISTYLRVGGAIGDFKKGVRPPLCDILQCDEDRKSLLKIEWPVMRIGNRNQLVSFSIGYERRIKDSYFSVNTEASIAIRRQSKDQAVSYYARSGQPDSLVRSSANSIYGTARFTVQPRYYFSHWLNHGKTLNNLSGLYAGLWTSYEIGFVRLKYDIINKPINDIYSKELSLGLSGGIQQKIFKNGFIDIGGILSTRFVDTAFPNIIPKGWQLQPYLNLGFAF